MATTLTIEVLTDVAKAVAGIDSIDQKTSSWGSTLKAAGGAIAGAFSISKIEGWAKEWIAAGMDAKRAAKDVAVVFGASAEEVNKWAETTGQHFGMTATEAEKAAAKVGIALKGYGMSQAEAATQSEKLVQRSADMAKVLGVDQAEVLAKLETAMRGRTAGLKDYGVQVQKGADATQVFNAFMDQTTTYAGQSDTAMGQFHATMGNVTEQLGLALIPVLNAILPLLQMLGNWARSNKVVFDAIVIVIMALALAFSIAATAAGIFAIASLGALWPILAVVAGIGALIAVIVIVIKYWSDLVGWMHTAASAVNDFIGRFQVLLLLFGGPLGAALVALHNFQAIWGAIEGAIHGVESAINAVIGAAEKVGNALSKIPGAGLISKLNPFTAPPAAPGVSSYGAATTGGVVFAPSITISGDVGDPALAGRRIVAALEAWTAANGRRRIAALVAP